MDLTLDWEGVCLAPMKREWSPPRLVIRRPGISPPPPKLPSKRWRDLILRVWHVDPLRCPVCQHPRPRVARQLATLGWKMESLWDSRREAAGAITDERLPDKT